METKRILGTIEYDGKNHPFTNLWFDNPETGEGNLNIELVSGKVLTYTNVCEAGSGEPDMQTVTLDLSGFKAVLKDDKLQ